jgi:hypothetical protein
MLPCANSTLYCRNLYAYAREVVHGDIMLKTEEYLIETADQCIRLAREGRALIERLEVISHELMARAVELDTMRDKQESGARGEGETPAP